MRAEEVIALGESRRVNYAELAAAAAERRGGAGRGRRLLVGMKLNTSCREMLTWTIAKLAQPGDHILAIHVCSQPFRQGATDEEEEDYTKQLANTLRGVLSVYESLCSLKQIKLQLEIICGYKVKDVLVQVASSYEACKLILGTNKSFSIGRTKALGRYCLKRLPCTCTVVILEQGDIIFDKKGRLGTAMTRLDMIKVFGRTMRIGRSRKLGSSKVENLDDDNNNNNKNPSHRRQRSMAEVPDNDNTVVSITPASEERDAMSFGSCSSAMHDDFSNSLVSVLPRTSTSGFEALRICYSKRRAQGTLKASAAAAAAAAGIAQRSDMFLVDDDDDEGEDASLEAGSDSEDDAVVPGWPLLNNTIGFANQTMTMTKKTTKKTTRTTMMTTRTTMMTTRTTTTKKLVGNRVEPLSREFSVRKEAEDRMRDPSLSLAEEVGCLCCCTRACTAFSFEDLEAATSCFSPENVVGRGGGSEVFRGNLRDGRVVAVKRLNPGPQAEEELLVDIEINTTLAHPHVVSLLGYCVEASHLLLVYDYLPQGNLEDHLHAPAKDATVLPWEVRHKVALGIARALEYLHKGCSRPVVHRDVKTSNILLTANFESQLSDFGLAKWAPTKTSHLLCNDVVGTFGYLAPEYFMFGRVNDKTDVYAFGVVLLELITGRKPIDTTRPKGEENLVNWARPLLVEGALSRLVDPLLGGAYDVAQMNNMALAAFLSIQQSAPQRSQMNQILQVLAGNHNKNLSARMATSDVMSTLDPEEVDTNNYGSEGADIRSHLALAMVGVDDDSTSQCSVMDIPHSNRYLEEYLQGRFSRSASFED